MATENGGALLVNSRPDKEERYLKLLLKTGLSYKEYDRLHRDMKKERPKVPPHDLACVGRYEPDPKNFRWMCRSCHFIFDCENGTRKNDFDRVFSEETRQKLRLANSSEGNPFYGRKHDEETRQKMCGPRPSISGDKHPNFGKKFPEHMQKMLQARGSITGDKNPFFGKKHSAETMLRMVLTKTNNKVVKLRSMSGRFQTKLVGERRW